MSDNTNGLELPSSQVKFAANLTPDQTRKSEYLKTNFQSTKNAREVKLEALDYDTHIANERNNFTDYYAGLKANEAAMNVNQNMFVKDSFQTSPLSFIFHCILLAIAVVCGSSVGVFYFYIQPEGQFLKASWRLLFLTICIFPLVIFEYFKQRERFVYSSEVIWNGEVWKKLIIATIGHSIWTIALVIAVNHTSIAQANLLINLHPIIIIVYKLISRSSIVKIELIGAALAIIGVILVFLDSDIDSAEGFINLAELDTLTRNSSGNVVAILGSIGGAIYFSKNHELKYEYPFFLGILMMSFIGFILISLLAIIMEGAYFSFDPELGLFGLFSSEWILTYVLTIAVTGFGAYIGYIASFQYFQPLLLSIVPNTEPIFATLLVIILGWQSFPGVLTAIAFLLIIPGTILIIFGNREVEVREHDIGDDSSLPLMSFRGGDPRTIRGVSILRHHHASSAVAPISWEK